MVHLDHDGTRSRGPMEERLEIVGWAARLGAVSAEALAHALHVSVPSARGRLQGAVKADLLTRSRTLADGPALYAATRAGMRAAGVRGLDPCRITAANARHLGACAAVAAALQHLCPDHAVRGERELRRDEREHGGRLASARLGAGREGEDLLHRPDLVLWPRPAAQATLPVAIEVEITVKGRRRLERICRAWARCRLVAGVIYLAPAEVEAALTRAIASTHAGDRVAVLPLSALPGPISQTVPSSA